ncbi:MAG: HDOD domain-containing protein [Lachnospiraceae bacterium]|nr:HDOD domain-containing protein [Lachnospiraceae bacterium]
MLASLIPLFDKNMMTCAYSIFAQKQDYLKTPYAAGSGRFDGAGYVAGFEIVDSSGIDTLSGSREVFIAMDSISIYSDLDSQTKAPHDKLVLLMGPDILPDENNVRRIKQLKDDNYKLAIRNITIDKFEEYREILKLVDYIFLDHKKIKIQVARVYFQTQFPNLKLVAINVDSQEDYDKLTEGGGYSLYEGDFFRLPKTTGDRELAPLKMNYLSLLNLVNAPDFDLTKAADIIQNDAALVVSLLEIVNHMAMNSEITSVRHAAAMLGQKELKKWINTAVTKELCADRPSEITRISMLRAKFAENLAELYGMGGMAQELFLMGMFSVLDLMLDKPMKEALSLVKISKNIDDALLERKGDMGEVLTFIEEYEKASWQEVSRLMILKEIEMNDVYKAYLDSLSWFRDLMSSSTKK